MKQEERKDYLVCLYCAVEPKTYEKLKKIIESRKPHFLDGKMIVLKASFFEGLYDDNRELARMTYLTFTEGFVFGIEKISEH